jgi:hypothetical protein
VTYKDVLSKILKAALVRHKGSSNSADAHSAILSLPGRTLG